MSSVISATWRTLTKVVSFIAAPFLRLGLWAWAKVERRLRLWAHYVYTKVEPLLDPIRVFVDHVREKIGEWIKIILFILLYFIFASAVAVLLYFFLYYHFIPSTSFGQPLYFEFRETEPRAVATFREEKHRAGLGRGLLGDPALQAQQAILQQPPLLTPGYAYDFSITLQMPESPENNNLGMFMINLLLYSAK
jgi:hypothetical protein